MKKRNREKGVALLFALGMLALLMVLGLAFVTNAILAQKVARNNSARAQARMFAMSAVNRAAASIMLYQQQVYVGETAMPEDFSSIYSFGYSPNSTTADSDALIAKTASVSLMKLPEDDSVIAKALAKEYNTEYFDAGGSWPGSWIYFYDDSGSGRKIVGRAAWQVLSNAPQISAPVFFRGEMEDNGPVPQNRGFIPQQNRWGREIDEVYFANTDILGKLHDVYDGRRIKDYDDMCTVLGGNLSDAQKMWLKRWFTPDPDAHDNNKACWNPTPMVPEVYEYRKSQKSGLIQMLRFNISELSPATDFSKYGGGTKGTSDPWYLRFGINSASENADINSDTALTRLTQAGESYLPGYLYDYDVPVEERGGLPFLRRIGSEPGSFADLATLRKQIAANFNDYCDADSIPTSNVPAAKWGADLNDDFQEPSYTGNEKTPYLYEIGLQLGMHAAASGTELNQTGIGAQLAWKGLTASLTPSAVFRLAPMVKLANVYPFVPGAQETDFQGLVRKTPGNLKALVDFADLKVTMKITKIKANISGIYVDPATGNEVSFTLSKNIAMEGAGGNLPDLSRSFTLTANKAENSQCLSLADDKVKHDPAQGFNHPYPFFSAPADGELQKLDTVTAAPAASATALPSVTLDAETINAISPGTIPSGGTVKTIDGASTLEPVEVAVSNLEVTFRRAVLLEETTANLFVGLDYVKGRSTAFSWPGASGAGTTIELVVNKNGSRNGIIAGLMRNYDPRQNLNNGDWVISGSDAPLLAKAEDYKTPKDSEVKGVMAVEDSKTGSVNTLSGDTHFSPENSDETLFDCETVKQPAWQSDTDHLSTAFIRNAPMMSPWEIGLIHRGARWQTINIKNAGAPGAPGKTITTVGLKPPSGWGESGTPYGDGDGALLEQIKMTEQILTYGKINVNKFRYGVPGFDPEDPEKKDQNIVQSLFEALPYNMDMNVFLTTLTKRDSAGKFPAPESKYLYPSGSGCSFLGKKNAMDIYELFRAQSNQMNYPDGLGPSDKEQTAGVFATRSQFLNWEIGGHSLYDAFGKASEQKTDVQMEEIVGRTVNLLTAAPSTPSQVQIVVVAQAITDVEGMQYRTAPDTANYTATSGSVAIDSDGLASKNCENGRFDAYIHSTDDNKNIYFDEITGEVKMFVTLERNPESGRMMIRKIDYME